MTAAETLEVDLAVIGFGKGGKTLAAALAKQGWTVAMVEKSPLMYGGTCINIGCVPTKSLVYRSEHLGAETVHPAQYREAVSATATLTADLRAVNLTMLEKLDNATVLTGTAQFVDPHTIEVSGLDGSTVSVSARFIVVGTGSEPVIPDIPGLADSAALVTSTDLLSRAELPAKLVVLGGGYVGLEFASMYRAYGAEVTVIERGDRILAREDSDVAECARAIMADNGIRVLTGVEVTGVTDHGAAASVDYRQEGDTGSVEADAILAASGRRPVMTGLGLESAGVATNSRGIVVDEFLRTSQPHIFAVGDVNGGPQFTYVSLDDYRVVLSQLVGDGSRSTAARTAVPYTLFITPPLARVGLTEQAARDAGADVRVAAMQVADMATVPRARIVGDTDGTMKVVVDAADDTILGAALLCYDSHEVINTVALAMRHGITATELRDAMYTHPSMTEAFNQLLGAL